MKNLTSIVHKLSLWEVTQLTNFYQQEGKRESSLRLALLDLILKNPKLDVKEASKKIYNKPAGSAFSNLKRRLLEDILDIIIVQNSQGLYSYRLSQIKHDCQKKILASEILIQRGEYEAGWKILENSLKIAEQYELFNESISIRFRLASSKGVREEFNKITKYFEDIEADIESLKELTIAQKISRQISLLNKFKTGKKKSNQQFLQEQITKLKSLNLNKDRISGIYYRTLVYYYHENKDFDAYLEVIKKYEELVQPGRILHSDGNLAWAYISTAEVYINLEQYEKAIHHGRETLDLLTKNRSNRVVALRFVFIAFFHSEQYAEAQATIQEAYAERLVKSNVLEKARFNFFAACIAFQKGDIDEARTQLQSASKIANKDSTGWLLGYKILEMMIAISEKSYYMLSVHLDNSIKLINNHKEAQTERARLIFKILRMYNKLNFNKKETLDKVADEFILLKEGKGEYYWDPISYELIRFDKWFLTL